MAALTHPGEDEIALQAHDRLLEKQPDLLLLLVPRHPARADDVAALVSESGHGLARRSCGDAVVADTGVYLGDTHGEMGLFYRLAPVTFLGGSFNEAGGHNPVEAVLLGSALVTGPKVANARAVYKDLWEHGAALKVLEPVELAPEIANLMDDPDHRKEQVERAMKLVFNGRGALNRTAAMLKPMLARTSQAGTLETGNGQGA